MSISFFQADVLVCSIASDNKNLASCGEVASSFVRCGGQALCDDYLSIGGITEGKVVAHHSSLGGLHCKLILFASIRSWNSKESKQVSMVCKDVQKWIAEMECRNTI